MRITGDTRLDPTTSAPAPDPSHAGAPAAEGSAPGSTAVEEAVVESPVVEGPVVPGPATEAPFAGAGFPADPHDPADPDDSGDPAGPPRRPDRRAAHSAGLQRDLDILDVLASAEGRRRGLGVVRIAERLGRENSQVSRALRALAEAGMVERDPRTLDYRLGWRLYAYAARTVEARLVHTAVPYLRRLVASLHETTHLCVLRGRQVLTLWTEAPPHAFRARVWEGVSVPAVATSAGRVLMSDWPAQDVTDWFGADLPGPVERPRLTTVEDLHRELAAVRSRGYALERDEFEAGLAACAAPVRGWRGEIIAALNLTAPESRLGSRLEAAAKLTARATSDISRALRHDPA